MARVKSILIDKEGYCIVENSNKYSLYAPGKVVEKTTLSQIKTILTDKIRSVEDAGMVISILSFFRSGRNNDLHNSTW